MDTKVPCTFEVGDPPGYWNFHSCGRPGKFTIITRDGIEKNVCGTHRRMHERHPLHSSYFVREKR